MGGLPKEGAPAVDVSVEGTLVWLRRPNGSWWPSIVISPQDVPEGCAPPPRCPATPIMLLGRRPDGPTYVDWCNLDRCKRVKPFRCGELDLEQRIANALTLAATSDRSTWSYNKGRYARMEDAILQALDIEKELALGPATKAYLHARSCSPRPKVEMPNGQVKDTAAKDHAPTIQPPLPPPKRKRKTPYDSEDDVPEVSRRMRDLRDIGSKAVVPMDLANAAAVSAPKYDDLTNAGQAKRIVHSQATAKRKHAGLHQDQPCGIPRKKDRSRPLSELCNGDMWGGSRPNGQKADEHLLGVATCSSSSSGTSTLDTPLDMNNCHRSMAFKTDQAKGTEISCMTRLLSDDSRHGNDFVGTPAAQNIVEPGKPALLLCNFRVVISLIAVPCLLTMAIIIYVGWLDAW
ncbi:Tudor/PWWP/MBT superfamily protein [Zea mays]|uniref:Tudor/PWWP/MBT superfamily protein n=2 Tax=Zea mays TaxID=4577 RepID=A0A1D6FLQ9_MAIZE|nr:Tudor/PWWP/MBT superfamily protein [Zea mays]